MLDGVRRYKHDQREAKFGGRIKLAECGLQRRGIGGGGFFDERKLERRETRAVEQRHEFGRLPGRTRDDNGGSPRCRLGRWPRGIVSARHQSAGVAAGGIRAPLAVLHSRTMSIGPCASSSAETRAPRSSAAGTSAAFAEPSARRTRVPSTVDT